MHQGDSIPGFPSVYAFMYLLSNPLQKLREPAVNCLNEVFEHLRKISTDLIQKLFVRFPNISDEVIEIADNFFSLQKEKAQYVL
jgi:dynamin 1-like protein